MMWIMIPYKELTGAQKFQADEWINFEKSIGNDPEITPDTKISFRVAEIGGGWGNDGSKDHYKKGVQARRVAIIKSALHDD